jgi:hypothetical protein
MLVKNPVLLQMLEGIGEYYQDNIAAKYLRPAIYQLNLPKATWSLIEHFTGTAEYSDSVIHLEDLYRQIVAVGSFVSLARKELVLEKRIQTFHYSIPPQDRLLHEMSLKNFDANLNKFAALVHDFYHKLIEMDTNAAKNRNPVYTQIPETESVEQLLSGRR